MKITNEKLSKENLQETELKAREKMIRVCKEIADDFGEDEEEEEDDDESNDN